MAWLLLLTAICASITIGPQATSIDATDFSHVIWQGRVIYGDQEEPNTSATFAWGGVKAMFNVQGATRVSMSASKTHEANNPAFKVFLNGSPINGFVKLTDNGLLDYTLAEGLTAQQSYTVTLWYVDDALVLDNSMLLPDRITITGFHTDAGVFGAAPPARKRSMLIIGDSIASGNQMSHLQMCRPNNPLAYTSKLCESFRVNCTSVALSGKGVKKNCCDEDETMLDLYERMIPGDPSRVVATPDAMTDAILINLGANDFISWKGSVGERDEFIEAYTHLLFKLTVGAGQPNLPVFCAYGPIPLEGKQGESTRLGSWVQVSIQKAIALGSTRLYTLNFFGVQKDGCMSHPGVAGHEQMFQIAHPVFQQTMEWDVGDESEPIVKLDECETPSMLYGRPISEDIFWGKRSTVLWTTTLVISVAMSGITILAIMFRALGSNRPQNLPPTQLSAREWSRLTCEEDPQDADVERQRWRL
jgi:lysophospholipase L1-like esterase